FGFAEVALAVAEEDPRLGVWVVRLLLVLAPLGHLGGENVQVTVAVDVGDLEAVAVDDLRNEFVPYPSRGIFGLADALVPLEGPDTVAAIDDDLRVGAGFELADCDAAAEVSELDCLKRVPLDVLEPVVAGDDVDLPVAVHVGCGKALVVCATLRL